MVIVMGIAIVVFDHSHDDNVAMVIVIVAMVIVNVAMLPLSIAKNTSN